MLNNFNCGSFVFNSSFDSGNLHRVELQKNPVDCELTIHVERVQQSLLRVMQFTECMKEKKKNRKYFLSKKKAMK